MLVDLGPQLLGHLARRHGRATRVGGDREAGGNGDAERGHLGEPDALAAEELPPARSLLVECVDQAHGADPTYGAQLRRALEDPAVQRVAVIATASGCGKTTFGRALARLSECRSWSSTRSTIRPGGRSSTRSEFRRRVEPLVARRRVGDRRLLPRQARRPRARGRGHGRLARPAAPCLAPASRRQDTSSRRDARGALERQPGVARGRPSSATTRSSASALETSGRAAIAIRASSRRFRVARLRTQREVDAFLRSAVRAETRWLATSSRSDRHALGTITVPTRHTSADSVMSGHRGCPWGWLFSA